MTYSPTKNKKYFLEYNASRVNKCVENHFIQPLQNNTKNIMKTIAAIAFIGFVYASPVVAILTVIIALFVASIVAEFLATRNAQDAELDQHYTNLKTAFDDVFADEPDIWTTTDVASCELACTLPVTVTPVLALPPCTCIDSSSEQVIIIDYTECSYRELQAMVKAQRKSTSDIKLNAKREVLQD